MPSSLATDAPLVATAVCYDGAGLVTAPPALPLWTSATPDLIALIPNSDGTCLLRAKAVGTARLTATAGALTADAEVAVTPGAAVRLEITLSPFVPTPNSGK